MNKIFTNAITQSPVYMVNNQVYMQKSLFGWSVRMDIDCVVGDYVSIWGMEKYKLEALLDLFKDPIHPEELRDALRREINAPKMPFSEFEGDLILEIDVPEHPFLVDAYHNCR